MRAAWTSLNDSQLLNQCEVDTYRASGPGGQKRNKTSSAVRLRHAPTGLIVIAEESRSQHENRARALRRMREACYLKVRDPLRAEDLDPQALAERPELRQAVGASGRLALRRKDPRYWPLAGLVLDVLAAMQARVSDVADALDITTANLIAFLEESPKVWEQVNILRAQYKQKPLRSS
jgi:hypothetical protein